MTTITTHQTKTHLSRYLAEMEQGREFIIARGKVAVAKLVPITRDGRRPKAGKIQGKPFKFSDSTLAPPYCAGNEGVGTVKLLLDTCAFLWVSQQPSKLSKAATAAFDDPHNELFVSDVSLWEISLKHSAGKLPLPENPRTWIPAKFAYHGLQPLSLRLDEIFLSGELPRVHEDPFDRLLAAQAMAAGMSILSPDSPLSLLGASRIW